MDDDKGIQKTSEDSAYLDRVAESLVTKGDVSALSSADKAKYYIGICESIGLNPSSQPFALLRLNGKEVMYPTRGATDQLAAIHRLNRRIIDGPKIMDLNGTKLAYAMCEATHPNGRVETAIATVPFTDPANVLMKVETKAKRRATLSILGLGMLDESELDTIPQGIRVDVTPSELATAPEQKPSAGSSEPLDVLRGRLTDGDSVATMEALVDVYDELACQTDDAGARSQAHRMCVAHLEETLGIKRSRGRFKAAIDDLERKRAETKRSACEAIVSKVAKAANDNSTSPTIATADYSATVPAGESDPTTTATAVPDQKSTAASVTAADLPPIDQAEREYDLAKSMDEITAITAEVASYKLPKESPGRKKLAEAYKRAVARLKDPEREAIESEDKHAGDKSQLDIAVEAIKACESSVHVVRHYAAHVGGLPKRMHAEYLDASARYLTARYNKAVPTHAAALDMLADAVASKDANGKSTQVTQ